MIYGAGLGGISAARELFSNSEAGMRPVGFIDDDPKKWNQRINGLTVFGPAGVLDSAINQAARAVVISLHAEQTIASLAAGKDVFVEKPLSFTWEELRKIEMTTRQADSGRLLVGFNRRFAPLAARRCVAFVDRSEPMVVIQR